MSHDHHPNDNVRMPFFTFLSERVEKTGSLLCIGLDPHLGQLKERSARGAEEFCLSLIQETQHLAAAYKPNAAFFEQFGDEGFATLQKIIQCIPSDIPVILDAKRGDISTTASAYASAAFDYLHAHAITLVPYMGEDTILPFVGDDLYRHKGCFVLCKTSNPSSKELQNLYVSDSLSFVPSSTLYEKVATLATSSSAWNKQHNIGLVIGATDIEALRRVRRRAKDAWFLVPGIGAQQGDLQAALSASLRQDRSGVLITVSRGISQAVSPRKAAEELNQKINAVRKNLCALCDDVLSTTETSKSSKEKHKHKQKKNAEQFIAFCLRWKVLQWGTFELKSGRISPYFMNLGQLCTGESITRIGEFYAHAIQQSRIQFDVLLGAAYKGIPLVASIAIAYRRLYQRDVPFAYNRKERKCHGEQGQFIGSVFQKQRVLLVDDVITAGTAIDEIMTLLAHEKATVVGVCVSFDRQEKLHENSRLSAVMSVKEKHSMEVICIANASDLVEYVKTHPKEAMEVMEPMEPKESNISESLEKLSAYMAQYGVTGSGSRSGSL